MLAAFVEERIAVDIDYGAVGGPEFMTVITANGAGYERRNVTWSQARGRWQLGSRMIDRTEADYFLGFFRARRGKAVGFRWRDWNDYQATAEVLPVGDGTPTRQLVKTSGSGVDAYVRDIRKPVAGATFTRAGVDYPGVTLDTTTGIMTMPSDESHTIIGITNANPCVVSLNTVPAYTVGDRVYLAGIAGTVELNDAAWSVAAIDTVANTITLSVDATAFGVWTSGGTVDKYAQPGEALTWSGEFDVPVRFDADILNAEFRAHEPATGKSLFWLSALPVVEIRV